MMNKRTLRLLLISCITTFIFSSCINNDYDLGNLSDNIILQGESAVMPIGEFNTTIEDILKKAGIKNLSFSGDSIYLNFRDTMILTPEKPINLIPFTVSKDFSVPSIAGHYETTMNHEFTVNSANPLTRVDRVSISDTRLKLVVHSGMSTPIQLQVVLPEGITLNDPTQATITIQPGNNTKYLDVKDNSMLIFKNDAENPYITIGYIIDVFSSTSPVLSSVHFDFTFESYKVNVLYGYFPDIDIDEMTNEINIDFFDRFFTEGTSLHFYNPIINCTIKNHIGITTEFDVNYIHVYDENGNSVCADFNGSPGHSYTLERSHQLYEPSSTLVTLDRSMGATNRLFQIVPKKFVYSFKTKTLAEPGEKHFIITDNYVNVLLDFQLPLTFDKGSTLVTRDTLNINLSDFSNKTKINDLVLRVNYTNKLPAKSILFAQFMDENKKPVAEIGEKQLEMKSSPVDTRGNATADVNATAYFKLNQNEMAATSKIKFVVLKVAIKGMDENSLISLHPKDYIRLKADLYINGDISLSNN